MKKELVKVGKVGRIIGIALLAIQVIAAVGVILLLTAFPLLPAKYMAAVIGALVIAAFLSLELNVICKQRKCVILGIVWAVIWIVLCILIIAYLEPARQALKKVTGQVATETMHIEGISVLVSEDDPAKTLQDTKGYVYGIQRAEEYASCLAAAQNLSDVQQLSITVKEYEFYDDLAAALMSGEIQAMIADSSYVVLLEEYVEGFEGVSRVLEELSFDTDIKLMENLPTPSPVPTPTPTPTPTVSLTPSVTPDATPSVSPEPTAVANPTPTPYCTPFPMPTRKSTTDITNNYFTVYFSGIDRYGAITVRSRSDVNIVMTVNPLTKHILLVTIPRDAYVLIPGVSGTNYDKLTHAGIYGVKTSMKTLEQVYGITIDYYVRVNFSSVEKFVDLLGGVDVYSAYDFSAGGYSYKKGMNHVNGKKALAFARERHSFASGDHQRGKDQMELIKGVIAKMQTPAVLNDFSGIMSTIADNFQTNLTMEQLASLCRMQLDSGASWTIDTYAVATNGGSNYCYSYKGAKLYVGYIVGDSVREATSKMRDVMNGH